MNRLKMRYLLLASALLLVSCGGSGIGCSGCASSCGGNPNYKFKGSVAKDSVQVRLTQGGVNFITARLKPIIENILKQSGQSLECSGNGISFPTQTLGNGPQVNGKPVAPNGSNCGIKVKAIPLGATCTGSTPNSTWFYGALNQSSMCATLDTKSVAIQLQEPSQSIKVNFKIPEVRIRSKAPDLGFCYKGKVSLIPGDICAGAKASLKEVQLILTQLDVTMTMKFSTDPTTGKVGLKIDKVDIGSSTQFSVKLDGCKNITIPLNIPVINRSVDIKLGGSLCTLATRGIQGIINGTKFLQPIIFRLLGGVIADQFKNLDLLAVAKVEMEIPLSSALGGLGSLPLPKDAKGLGVLMQPGKALGIVNGGLSLGMDSGFEPTANHPCVPVRPQPQSQAGPTPPLNGSYHIAAALSKASTNRALWAAYSAGVLCIKLDSSSLGGLGGIELNAGVLSLLAPDLTKIVPEKAPIFIAIQPTQPPEATFGTGKKVNGKTDSTIKLRIPDFGISFYVMMHDRYVRVFKMLLDANLGISLVSSPKNELEIAIDTDAIELKNARATSAYLVNISDPNSLLKLIVGILTQTLGSSGITVPVDISPQISKALGIPIFIKINQVAKEGAAGDWLALKLSMSDKKFPLMPTPRTFARLHQPPGLHTTLSGKVVPTGEVHVDVPEFLGPHTLEYQYKVDFGFWSTFHPAKGGVLRVRSPMLKVLGKHKVWIRARIKGDYRTREEIPALVEFTFDPIAPKIDVKFKQGNTIEIAAVDQVTGPQQLQYSYRKDGQWVTMDGPHLAVTKAMKRADRVAIRVQDQAGNARIVHWSPSRRAIVHNAAKTPSAPSPRSFGCSSTQPTPSDMVLWLLLLGFLVPLHLRVKK